MKKSLVIVGLLGAGLAALILFGDHYVEQRTVKIDDMVTLVTLDEHVIVIRSGEKPRVTRVRPPVVPAKDVRPDPKHPTTIKWTLPFSCTDARYYNSKFTHKQLDEMRKAAGMAMPSATQQQQIRACVAGRLPTG